MRTDGAIQRDVIDELRHDGRAGEAAVGVSVSAGVVTLSGGVDDRAARAAASEIAHRVPGVLDVVDHLEIRRPAARLADGPRIEDADLADAVRRALVRAAGARHRAVRGTISRGVVTLDGLVETPALRHGIARAVAAVPGVVALVDRLHRAVPDDGAAPSA